MAEDTLRAEEIARLYEKYGAALAAYACSCGLRFTTAEDAVQQVFLRLLREPKPRPETAAAYLYRAVRNTALNLLRDGKREVAPAAPELWFTRADTPLDDIVAMQDALRELPDEQRETVFLKIWGGMTLEEISEATEAPLNTVASRYRYALEKLRRALKVRETE